MLPLMVQSVFQDQQQLRPLIMQLQTQALYTAPFHSILTLTKHISESNIEVVCVDLSIDISYMPTPYGLKDSGEAQKEKLTVKNLPDN